MFKIYVESGVNINTVSVKILLHDLPAPDGYYEITSISDIIEYAGNSGADYCFIRDILIDKCESIGFESLGENDKKIISEFCASSDENLVNYYATTLDYGFGGDISKASDYHYNIFSRHLNLMRDVAEKRVKNPKLTSSLMKYLNGRSEVDTFTEDIRNLYLDYKQKFHKGLNYGDYRDGIMDFLENTGSYTENGVKKYQYSEFLRNIWINENAVNPLSPTEGEILSAKNYCMNNLVSDMKDILIYGIF